MVNNSERVNVCVFAANICVSVNASNSHNSNDDTWTFTVNIRHSLKEPEECCDTSPGKVRNGL